MYIRDIDTIPIVRHNKYVTSPFTKPYAISSNVFRNKPKYLALLEFIVSFQQYDFILGISIDSAARGQHTFFVSTDL